MLIRGSPNGARHSCPQVVAIEASGARIESEARRVSAGKLSQDVANGPT
jgi:hypothetical protein